MENNKKHVLSKSTYVRGLQCQKSLYFHKHSPELRDELDPAQQAIFSTGSDVGRLAWQLFPGGKDTISKDGIPNLESVRLTRQLIDAGEKIIYEAAFQFDGVLAAVDIMVRDKNKWRVYEVKSSTEVKDVYLNDAALQLYVLLNSALPVKDFSIVHINNQYVRKGDLDIQALFTIQSVYTQADSGQESVRGKIEEFKAMLAGKIEPKIDIGTHCGDPYPCDFHGHCWKHIPENSVFDITGLRAKKKFALYTDGIVRMDDIPGDYKLNASQRNQVECYIENKTLIDAKGIKAFVKNLQHPLHFFDFETFNPAVPLYDNSRPYQKIPFQYSLHIQGKKDSSLEHFEFLAETGPDDPRPHLIEQLLADVRETGDILVYNQAFEIGCLNDLAKNFPKYAKRIKNLIGRIKDLMVPFKNQHYYMPEMRGSYSIKAVYPALVPGKSYDDLAIQDGGMASNSFVEMLNETDTKKMAEIRAALLEYCKQDTLAMVEISDVLKRV